MGEKMSSKTCLFIFLPQKISHTAGKFPSGWQQHCWSGPVRWPGYNLCVARGGGSAIANTQGLFNNQESVPVAAVAALRTRGPGRPERLRLDPVRITLNASSGTRDLIPSARWTTGQQRGSGSGSSPFSSSSVRSSRQIIKIIFFERGQCAWRAAPAQCVVR